MITIAIFYYCYLLFVITFLLFSFFVYFHLVRFGLWSLGNLAIMIFYGLIVFFILYLSWQYLQNIDWSAPISFLQNIDWSSSYHLNNTNLPDNANYISY